MDTRQGQPKMGWQTIAGHVRMHKHTPHKQGCSDLHLPSQLLQFLWGKTKTFSGQPRDIICACIWHSSQLDMPEALPQEGDQEPSYIDAGTTSTGSFQSGAAVALLQASYESEFLNLSLRLSSDPLQRRILSATTIHGLILSVTSHDFS